MSNYYDILRYMCYINAKYWSLNSNYKFFLLVLLCGRYVIVGAINVGGPTMFIWGTWYIISRPLDIICVGVVN